MAQLKLRNPFDEAPAVSPPPAPKTRRRPPSANDEAARSAATMQAAVEVVDGDGPHPSVRLSVDLERPLHRRLRRWALERDQTASDVIRELLTSALDAAGY